VMDQHIPVTHDGEEVDRRIGQPRRVKSVIR
jgi:hypothetical protein